MDRKIEKKKWTAQKITGLVMGLLFLGFTCYGFFTDRDGAHLDVEERTLTIAQVERGAFREFVPVRGAVLPIQTV